MPVPSNVFSLSEVRRLAAQIKVTPSDVLIRKAQQLEKRDPSHPLLAVLKEVVNKRANGEVADPKSSEVSTVQAGDDISEVDW